MASPTVPVIVVVTDDAEVRAALTAVIESRGIGVIAYRAPAEVFDQRDVFSGICMIVDMDLPGGGVDLVKRLRAQGNRNPTILVAKTIDNAIQSAAASVDAIALLEIPVLPLVLFAAIGEALTPRVREGD